MDIMVSIAITITATQKLRQIPVSDEINLKLANEDDRRTF